MLITCVKNKISKIKNRWGALDNILAFDNRLTFTIIFIKNNRTKYLILLFEIVRVKPGPHKLIVSGAAPRIIVAAPQS